MQKHKSILWGIGVSLILLENFFLIGCIIVIWTVKGMADIQAGAMAAYAGSLQGEVDFDMGHRRLYMLTENGKLADTGEQKSGFHLWTWPYRPSLGSSDYKAQRSFVDAYNRKVHFMVAHPQKARIEVQKVQTPD